MENFFNNDGVRRFVNVIKKIDDFHEENSISIDYSGEESKFLHLEADSKKDNQIIKESKKNTNNNNNNNNLNKNYVASYKIEKKYDNHGVEILFFKCITCDKHFSKEYEVIQHLKLHAKKFVCPDCKKEFKQSTTLNQHRVMHSCEKPFNCEFCNKSFNRISTLISHRKIHQDFKPFACPMCPKKFHQKGNLKNHIFTHNNLRPYKCKYCLKGFNQMSNLVCHLKKLHSSEIIDPYVCKVCDGKFNKRADLHSHLLKYHPNQLFNENILHQKLYSRKNSNFQSQKVTDCELLQNICTETQDIKTEPNTAGIVIKAIRTDAMAIAKMKRETPFAVLHFLHGEPLLVRCLNMNNGKTFLRPVNQSELDAIKLKYSRKITSEDEVQIPIVATIYQKFNSKGEAEFEIKSPKNIYKFPNSNFTSNKNELSQFEQELAINLKSEISKTVIVQDCNWCKHEEDIEMETIESKCCSEPSDEMLDTLQEENINAYNFVNNSTRSFHQENHHHVNNEDTDSHLLQRFVIENWKKFSECEGWNELIADLLNS